MKRRTCRARLWRVVAVSHKCEPGALAGSILSDFDNMSSFVLKGEDLDGAGVPVRTSPPTNHIGGS
jgi:hypothetical protein